MSPAIVGGITYVNIHTYRRASASASTCPGASTRPRESTGAPDPGSGAPNACEQVRSTNFCVGEMSAAAAGAAAAADT